MHILGAVAFAALADPYDYETFKHLLPMNQFMSVAILMVTTQVIFAYNFIRSMFFLARRWAAIRGARSEWFAPSPPGHGKLRPAADRIAGRMNMARRKSIPRTIRSGFRRRAIPRRIISRSITNRLRIELDHAMTSPRPHRFRGAR